MKFATRSWDWDTREWSAWEEHHTTDEADERLAAIKASIDERAAEYVLSWSDAGEMVRVVAPKRTSGPTQILPPYRAF